MNILPSIPEPELFFGFVAPIGTDIQPTLESFRKYLEDSDYRVCEIKVTNIFDVLTPYIPPEKTTQEGAP